MTAHELMTIRDSDWRRIYLLQHPLALTVATVLLLTGLLLLLSPPLFRHSVVATALPAGLEYPWDLTLIVGGTLMLAGFWKLNANFEAAGAIMLSSALFVWDFVYVAGETGTPVSLMPAALAAAVAIGFSFRALVVVSAPEAKPWSRRSH